MAESLIAAAEEARKKAASVGGEWRDTGEMIKSAQTWPAPASSTGDRGRQRRQVPGERGYEQAMAEKDADFPDYMLKAVPSSGHAEPHPYPPSPARGAFQRP
jgi:hypothetical protein